MSFVTNVILHMGMLDEDEQKPMLAKVNAFFGERRGFVHVEDENLPDGWYGGSKMLECDLAIGAFNYLNLPGLIEHLRGIEWPFKEGIQLIVKEQDDERFRLIDIFQ